jgi:hypothetical protein
LNVQPQHTASPFVDAFVGFSSDNEIVPGGGSPFAADAPFREDHEAVTSETSLILSELYDPSFEQATLEAAAEAAALSWARRDGESPSFELEEARAEQLADEQLRPVAEEMERRLDDLSQQFYDRPLGSVTEAELDGWASELAAKGKALAPSFENLFGGVFKKLKTVVGKGVKAIKAGAKFVGKLALGPLIAQVRKFIRPIIQRVLQLAFDKLPPQFRPWAEKLARSFGVKRPQGLNLPVVSAAAGLPPRAQASVSTATAAQPVDEPPLAQDAAGIQTELDSYLSRLVSAQSESDAELIAHEYLEAANGETDLLPDLAAERERFVDALLEMDTRADPTPAVQRFLPAALLPIKAAIKLAGRGRVMGIISGLIAKLIRNIVGGANARPLADAIVKTGFSLLQLEAGGDGGLSRVGANAVAATVEETARALASAPEHVLEDSELLEAEVLRAFHGAAARNLPPILPVAVYRDQPDLRESRAGGVWALMPVRGRKLYKKYSRVFDVKIPPDTTRWLRLPPGQDFRAHLYELVPGTTLFHVARAERGVRGLGTVGSASRLIPLTLEAASAVLGEPRLAGPSSRRSFAPRVGARYVYLEPKTLPRTAPAQLLLPTQVHLTLDLLRNEARAALFIDEATAQELSLKLRRRLPAGYFVRHLSALLEGGLSPLDRAKVAVIDDAVTPAAAGAKLLDALPQRMHRSLAEHLVDWAGSALADNRQAYVAAFLSATEDPAPGVQVLCTFRNAQGLATVRRALSGGPVSLAEDWFGGAKPDVEVRFQSGPFHA